MSFKITPARQAKIDRYLRRMQREAAPWPPEDEGEGEEQKGQFPKEKEKARTPDEK